MREQGLKLNVVGLASSRKALFSREGIDLGELPRGMLDSAPQSDIRRLRDEVIGMNIFNSVFVDCTASPDVAGLYKDFLDHNINVVAANKIAASSDYENYRRLKQTAQKRGVKFLFETNVGAGLPIIRTINDLIHSGDKILRIEAVLSAARSTSSSTRSAADVPFSETVRMAKAEGYSEPDPRIDLSGKDVIRKLVILTREAGYKIEQADVRADLFIPESLLRGHDGRVLAEPAVARCRLRAAPPAPGERGKRVALRGQVRGRPGQRGSCEEFDQDHPFYVLEGSNNIVLLTTERYKEYPMLIQGYGAGASVTAAGVFADIMSLA